MADAISRTSTVPTETHHEIHLAIPDVTAACAHSCEHRCEARRPARKLSADGKPLAVIVLPDKPSNAAWEGANILQEHLLQISGARLNVLNERDLGEVKVEQQRLIPAPDKVKLSNFILVGEGTLANRLGANSKKLGPGGTLIRTYWTIPRRALHSFRFSVSIRHRGRSGCPMKPVIACGKHSTTTGLSHGRCSRTIILRSTWRRSRGEAGATSSGSAGVVPHRTSNAPWKSEHAHGRFR